MTTTATETYDLCTTDKLDGKITVPSLDAKQFYGMSIAQVLDAAETGIQKAQPRTTNEHGEELYQYISACECSPYMDWLGLQGIFNTIADQLGIVNETTLDEDSYLSFIDYAREELAGREIIFAPIN